MLRASGGSVNLGRVQVPQDVKPPALELEPNSQRVVEELSVQLTQELSQAHHQVERFQPLLTKQSDVFLMR